MNKIIKIYCEGKKGSHDYDILEKVISGIPNTFIDPIGSIRGAGAIIQYKEQEIVKSNFKILFRDRDFDKAIPNEETLENDEDKQYIYYSYRNTIENYLFNAEILFHFIKEQNLKEKYEIESVDDVKKKMIDAANKIRVYQAVRHTMGEMRTHLTNFGTKLTDRSGTLPDDLSEEYCKNEALKKIEKAKSYTEEWSENKFNIIYQKFLKMFDDNFMNNFKFLIYFQGKDYASSLKSILLDFPLRSYYKFAKKHFNYSSYKDLVELRELIEKA